MKIVAHLGVLDEVDLVEQALSHLFSIGIDHVIACDTGSTDGTLEILERLQSDRLSIVRLSNDTSWEEEDWQRIAFGLIGEASCDWVLFLDADEFWLPATGSLKNCAALETSDIVTVRRYNAVLTADGPLLPTSLRPETYDQVLLYCQPIPRFREHLEACPDVPWITGVPMPKVIGRTAFTERVTMGAHDIVAPDHKLARKAEADDVVIAHVPFSTPSRFHKRIKNIERFFAVRPNYFSGWQGWHWRRWMTLSQQGQIMEEYQRQIASTEQVAKLRRDGVVRSAAECLQERCSSSPSVARAEEKKKAEL